MSYIVELRNPENEDDRRLVEWSTVVDAPITYGMRPRAFVEHLLGCYGPAPGILNRLQRVRKTGTSALGRTWLDVIDFNRAGEGETCATPAELWRLYVIERPSESDGDDGVPVDVQALRDFAAEWDSQDASGEGAPSTEDAPESYPLRCERIDFEGFHNGGYQLSESGDLRCRRVRASEVGSVDGLLESLTDQLSECMVEGAVPEAWGDYGSPMVKARKGAVEALARWMDEWLVVSAHITEGDEPAPQSEQEQEQDSTESGSLP